MSTVPLKTGIPDIVDSDALNPDTLDPQYIDFYKLGRQYDTIKYKNDPITAEVDFWENLANTQPVDIAGIDSSGEFVAWWLDKYRKVHPKVKELLEELKVYRNDMVAKNYPFQQISDIIIKWEMKNVPDFLEEAEREKRELNESYQESLRQAEERKK